MFISKSLAHEEGCELHMFISKSLAHEGGGELHMFLSKYIYVRWQVAHEDASQTFSVFHKHILLVNQGIFARKVQTIVWHSLEAQAVEAKSLTIHSKHSWQ